jgi:polygalacturonase
LSPALSRAFPPAPLRLSDAVAIKAGLDWWGRTYGRPSYNLTFRRLTVGTAHGLSIGSEMSAGVSDVLFEDVTLDGASTGPRIKTQRGRGGYVANVTFRNIALTGVSEGIQLTEYYSATVPPQNASATPHFSNFTFDNVTSTRVPGGKGSIGFYAAGLPESVMAGVTLRNVDLGHPALPVGNCSYTTGACEGTVLPACPPCLTPQQR